MTRTSRHHPRFLTIGCIGCVGIAVLCGTLPGCALPGVTVTNVVLDRDVRNCSSEVLHDVGSIDVALVIDTSQSTGRPTGIDVDGDGTIRTYQRNSALDRGDSRLAAQVAAVERLLRDTEDRDIRFSIITFNGPGIEHTVGRTQLAGSRRDSRIVVDLTTDRVPLRAALREVLERGSDGQTIFFGGMQRAARSLRETRDGAGWRRRKVVLLMSDRGTPNGLALDGRRLTVDSRMRNAAQRARNRGIVFHTFGLSPDSPAWRSEALGQIAGATGGTYHPVEDPEQLRCHLVSSLRPQVGEPSETRASAPRRIRIRR
jgi:Mg-chelatase subunit ChlD